MSILVAYNAHAGSFSQKRFDRLLSAITRSAKDYEIIDSHADDLPKKSAQADYICVYGGDGTLRDVIDRLAGQSQNAPVAIFPAGTINLVAREAGYSSNEDEFIQRLTGKSDDKNFHTALVNGHRFLACASIGPDSFAVNAVSHNLKKKIGRFAYAAAFMRQILTWKRPKLAINADGTNYTGEAVYILKGRYFAGPWRLHEQADLSRGEFAVVILTRAKRRDFFRFFLSIVLWKRLEPSACIRITCRQLKIESDIDAPLQADGDIVSNLPASFELSRAPARFR